MEEDKPTIGKHWTVKADRELSFEEFHRLSLLRVYDAMDDLKLRELVIKRTDA